MTVKAFGTKELRNKLSSYLREVRAGTRILVLDRDEVVAELHEPTGLYVVPCGSRAEELVKQGKLIRLRREPVACTPSHVKLPSGSGAACLDADRMDSDGSVR